MTTTLKAHFDGKVIVPDEAIELPIGASLRIAVTKEPDDMDSLKSREAAKHFLSVADRCNLHVGTRTWTREDLYER